MPTGAACRHFRETESPFPVTCDVDWPSGLKSASVPEMAECSCGHDSSSVYKKSVTGQTRYAPVSRMKQGIPAVSYGGTYNWMVIQRLVSRLEAVCKGRCPTALSSQRHQKGTTKNADSLCFFCSLSQLIQLLLTFTDKSDINTILSFYEYEYNIAQLCPAVNRRMKDAARTGIT